MQAGTNNFRRWRTGGVTMKIGALCARTCYVTGAQELCQIVSLYDKRDIDPECPESVAIIPFVKAVWLTGGSQGHPFFSSRRNFRRAWEVISDT